VNLLEPKGLNAIPLPCEVDENCQHNSPVYYKTQQFLPPFLRNLRQEDIILIALIILLLMEGNDCDLLLVGILVVVFLAGLDNTF
jgi:hypothetical protein